MTHLQELYDAVKAGTFLMYVLGSDELAAHAAFGGSMNGAVWFCEKSLPEYAWSVDRMGQAIVWDAGVEGDAISFDATVPGEPARALLLAALAAMIAKGAT